MRLALEWAVWIGVALILVSPRRRRWVVTALSWAVPALLLFVVIGGSFGYAAMQAWQAITSSS